MKLSELIREYVDAKIEGEPQSSKWRSIGEAADAQQHYHANLRRLEDAIDAAARQGGKDGA